MENEEGYIGVHPDKFLFSVDLVNYIFQDLYSEGERLDIAERFRDIAYNAFNENLRESVNFINLTREILPFNSDEFDTWDEDSYYCFVENLEEKLLQEGIEPQKFLHFCVDITVLAVYFFSNGLTNAANLAASVIYCNLVHYDMHLGGWESLNLAAKSYRDITNYSSIWTPDRTISEASADELQNRISPSFSIGAHSDEGARIMDSDDIDISDETKTGDEMNVANPENISVFNEEKNCKIVTLPNVLAENEHAEPVHDLTNSGTKEKDEIESRQQNVSGKGNPNMQLEVENLRHSFAAANDFPQQHVIDYQRNVDDNKSNTSGETEHFSAFNGNDANLLLLDISKVDEYLNPVRNIINSDTKENESESHQGNVKEKLRINKELKDVIQQASCVAENDKILRPNYELQTEEGNDSSANDGKTKKVRISSTVERQNELWMSQYF